MLVAPNGNDPTRYKCRFRCALPIFVLRKFTTIDGHSVPRASKETTSIRQVNARAGWKVVAFRTKGVIQHVMARAPKCAFGDEIPKG